MLQCFRMYLVFGMLLSFAPAHAAVKLVPLSDEGGLKQLQRSSYRADFFPLSGHYRAQTDRISCGLATGAIVLNALRYGTEKAPFVEVPANFMAQMPDKKDGTKFDPRIRMYTPESFYNEGAQKLKSLSRVYAEKLGEERDPGLQLEQLKRVFEEVHGLKVRKVVVGTKETARNEKAPKPLDKKVRDTVLTDIKKNLKEKGNFVVVNFARKELGQEGGGHISPVAAYDQITNSFLVLDVNPSGSPWFWVGANDLVNAMNTFDTVENRGALFLEEGTAK